GAQYTSNCYFLARSTKVMLTRNHVTMLTDCLLPALTDDRKIVFCEKQVQRLGHKPLLRNPLTLLVAGSEANFFQRLPISRRQMVGFGRLAGPRRRNVSSGRLRASGGPLRLGRRVGSGRSCGRCRLLSRLDG